MFVRACVCAWVYARLSIRHPPKLYRIPSPSVLVATADRRRRRRRVLGHRLFERVAAFSYMVRVVLY